MSESDEIRIQRMNLSTFPTPATDEIIDDEDYVKRNELYEALKSSDIADNKPHGTAAPFEVAENNSEADYIPCHLPIPILKIEGTMVNKQSRSAPVKKVPIQYAWAMVEAAEWCKENVTFDEIKGKNYTNFKVASNPETYPLPEYNEYVPNQVINAAEKYKQKYLDAYKDSFHGLKIDDIHITYYMIKCNFALKRPMSVDPHYKKVHLFPNANSLRKREIIAVNTTLEFKIADLTSFESTGPNKQLALLDSAYTHVLARGVFEAGTSRNGANLHKSMSASFMKKSASCLYSALLWTL